MITMINPFPSNKRLFQIKELFKEIIKKRKANGENIVYILK